MFSAFFMFFYPVACIFFSVHTNPHPSVSLFLSVLFARAFYPSFGTGSLSLLCAVMNRSGRLFKNRVGFDGQRRVRSDLLYKLIAVETIANAAFSQQRP